MTYFIQMLTSIHIANKKQRK